MAFKNIENASVEGYYEPSVIVTTPSGVDGLTQEEVTVNANPTVTTVVFNDPEKFVPGEADPNGTYLSNAHEANYKLLLRPINAHPYCEEVVNGGSYSLEDLGGSTATTITATAATWVPADGSVEGEVPSYETVEVTYDCAEKGPNVFLVEAHKDMTVVITPDSTILEQYNPLVDVDGKWSDSKVLSKGIKFTSSKNHRVNIHWTKDCVETFLFVAKL